MVATFYTEHYTNIDLDIIIDKYDLNRFSNLGDIEWCCADWCKNFGSGAERYLMNPDTIPTPISPLRQLSLTISSMGA